MNEECGVGMIEIFGLRCHRVENRFFVYCYERHVDDAALGAIDAMLFGLEVFFTLKLIFLTFYIFLIITSKRLGKAGPTISGS